MDYYDVIIVGAGPAGSTLARALETSGKQVLIIDKAEFPRDKTCAGWVTLAVLASLDIDTDDYSHGRTLQPIRRFRIGMMGQNAVENDHGGVVSYGIRRCEFDDYLLGRVTSPKQLGTPVKSISRENGNWIINDQWQAPLLIGAGGHFCPVDGFQDRKSTRLNSSHVRISYAVFCLKKKKKNNADSYVN